MNAITHALWSNKPNAIQYDNVTPKLISKMDFEGASIFGGIYSDFAKEKYICTVFIFPSS